MRRRAFTFVPIAAILAVTLIILGILLASKTPPATSRFFIESDVKSISTTLSHLRGK